MLDLQHQYNNCTTIPHMRVGPTYWGPPSCKGLLYWCCTIIKSHLGGIESLFISILLKQNQVIDMPRSSAGQMFSILG
jgi:hypothetical protein